MIIEKVKGLLNDGINLDALKKKLDERGRSDPGLSGVKGPKKNMLDLPMMALTPLDQVEQTPWTRLTKPPMIEDKSTD